MLYKSYSEHLQKKYKEKVYRIPLNLPISCPNRDGEVGNHGCTFCGDVGAGFESLSNEMSVEDQLQKNIEYIGKKYHSNKFIAYFQNYTNTYMPFDDFKDIVEKSLRDDVVAISISTRPDSINDKHLEYLSMIKETYQKDISIELGLQTVNYKTLKKINRGHTLAEFIDAVNRIRKYNFDIVAHVILNIPYDDMDDVIETAKIISALSVDSVKIHSLYIVKGTKMAEDYINGDIKFGEAKDYIERTAMFLAYLNGDIIIQRLVGRAPEEDTLFCNYGMSWWKIKDEIEKYMAENELYQGKFCDYLNGKAVKKFL
ncbi:MAG: TIGR01212 family radical SAM protein [Proteocatella sp.]